MDGAMGMEEEVVEAVLTCEGDFHDPELWKHVEKFKQRLTDLLLTDEDRLNVKKVEPWNSVKVTVTIPREAALRLRQLAQSGNDALREIGVLSVQLQGDSSISLTIAGRNNETTELMLRPSVGIPGTSSTVPFTVGGTSEAGNVSSENVTSFPSLSNEEVTRKNIVDYLIQGPSRRPNTSIFDTILGAGTSAGASPVLESGPGVPVSPNLFPGPMAGGPTVRPGQIPAMTSLPNPALRGSPLNSFPLSKGSGAFHIPLPNQSSAGQSPGGFYAQRMTSAIAKNTPNQPGPQSLPSGNPPLKNMPGGMNAFGPVGLRLPPSLTSPVNMNNALPPSSSPGTMMELPPPPPYPHGSGSNAQRPGKQVSASSPLLVNLLQTDPLAVAAGVASGNPNKAISVGDSPSAPPPKKKRSKKQKDGASKSVLPSETLSNSSEILGPSANVFNPIHNNESPRSVGAPVRSDFSAVSVSKFTKESLPGGLMDSRTGIPTSHITEPVHEDKSFKPLTSINRPYSESVFESLSSSTLSNLGTYSSSAIGTGNNRPIDSIGQNSSSREPGDLFSMEVAAGKIINPYTGQLEPRDSVLESNGGRMRDHPLHFQEGSALTAMAAKRDVGNSSFKNVPVSVSQRVDMNVLRTCPPVSSSTAAFIHSGPPHQISSDRLTPNIPPSQRNVISDNIDGPMSIYAARLNSKKETEHTFAPVASTATQPINSPQQTRQLAVSSSQHLPRTTNSSPNSSAHNVFSQTLAGHPIPMSQPHSVTNALPPHSMPIPSLASRVSATLSGSVISSELTHSSSFPISRESKLVQSQSNPVLFHPASCASSTARSQPSPHVSSSNSFPSSVLQTQPFSSSAPSVSQVPERLKSADSSTPLSYQQAATSVATSGSSLKSAFPNLLNPHSDKMSETSQSIVHSPQDKISSEGDDNSNHSGMVVENVTETSGTSVLLEHSGVKTENHDSGVGSSSERSDDTPSEPGDGEFRSNSNSTEIEDAGTKAAKRLVNCKVESGVDSSTSNTITVGYMMTSVDGSSQPNLLHSKDMLEAVKSTSVSLTPVMPDSKSETLNDSHVRPGDKALDRLSSNHAVSSMSWVMEMNKNKSPIQHDKVKLNGPLEEKHDTTKKLLNPEVKLNGPSSENEIGKMFIAMDDLQDQSDNPLKLRANVKGNGPDHLKLKDEDLDEIVKMNRASLAAEEDIGKINSHDKGDSPDHLSHALGGGEDRLEHLNYFDMEDLVNGKLLGNGAVMGDNKVGGNITSIYSKRSSPVNVNMLNHIYAPGLPLPRRLTESVQRLVKPLPASETSMPQMRLCKSPGMGSTRASGGMNGPSASRMSLHSGTRSPGASIPKLIPNDKHSLLSGGLDLAGLSSVSYQHALQASDMHLGTSPVSMKPSAQGMVNDLTSRDSQLLSSSSGPMPSISMDSVVHAQKILSQSYPPHKSRDPSTNAALYDLFSHIQPLCSSGENFSLPTSSHSSTVQTSKTNCDLRVSPPFSKSQAWKSANRPPASTEGALMNHTPVTSCHSSCNSNSLSLPTSENLARLEENASHSMNYFFDVVPSSSPEHSNSVLPNKAPGLQSKDFTDRVANASIQSSQSLSTASSSSPWRKISLANGGSSVSSGAHPTTAATSRHVPYLTYSSTTVTHSQESSAGCLIPQVAPSMSGAVLSTSASDDSKSDSKSALRPSPKSDISFPRTGSASSSLRRNLFESVSGELNSMQPVGSHTSLCRTLDAAIPAQHPKSVLDTNQSLRTLDDTFQPPPDQESLDYISLQSIRTNETPSTSLPAQVVHLDFPHYSSPTTSLSVCPTGVQPQLPKSPKVTSVPTSQPLPTLSANSWTLPGTSSSPFLSVPAKSSTVVSTHESNTVDTAAKTIASVASGQGESLPHPPKERLSPQNVMLKEPILETLASSLDPSLNKDVTVPLYSEQAEKSTAPSADTKSPPKQSEDSSAKMSQPPSQEKSSDPPIPKKQGSGKSQPQAEPSHETPARKVTRKRSFPGGDKEQQKDVNSDLGEESPAKCHAPDPKPPLSKPDADSDANAKKDEAQASEPRAIASKRKSVAEGDQAKGEESESTNSINQSHQANQKAENVEPGLDTQESKPASKVAPLTITNVASEKETKVNEPPKDLRDDPESEMRVSHMPETAEFISDKDSDVEVNDVQAHKDNKSDSKPASDSTKMDGEKDAIANDVFGLDKEMNGKNPGSASESVNQAAKPNQTSVEGAHAAKEDPGKDGTANALLLHPSIKTHPESKPDDTTRKGRVKRQFYAYVPEKSIDQTYFDTPILSGRTRSRNKTVEQTHTEVAPSQDGNIPTCGDAHIVNSGTVAGKGETSPEGLANKRSTRSLRTKETTQDPSTAKRRRIQSREHR